MRDIGLLALWDEVQKPQFPLWKFPTHLEPDSQSHSWIPGNVPSSGYMFRYSSWIVTSLYNGFVACMWTRESWITCFCTQKTCWAIFSGILFKELVNITAIISLMSEAKEEDDCGEHRAVEVLYHSFFLLDYCYIMTKTPAVTHIFYFCCTFRISQ